MVHVFIGLGCIDLNALKMDNLHGIDHAEKMKHWVNPRTLPTPELGRRADLKAQAIPDFEKERGGAEPMTLRAPVVIILSSTHQTLHTPNSTRRQHTQT